MATKTGFIRISGLIDRLRGRSREGVRTRGPMQPPTDSDLEGPFTRAEGAGKPRASTLMFASVVEERGPDSTSFKLGEAPAGAGLPLNWPSPPATADANVAQPVDELAAVAPPVTPVPASGAGTPFATDPSPSILAAVETTSTATDPVTLARRIVLSTRTLVAALVLSLLAALWMNYLGNAAIGNLAASTRMEMLSQRMAKAAQQVSLGVAPALGELRSSEAEFVALLAALTDGGEVEAISASATGGSAEVALADVRGQWEKSDAQLRNLLAKQSELAQASAALAFINSHSAGLLEAAERVAAAKLQTAPSTREVSLAGQLVMLTQRIDRNANALVAGGTADRESGALLARDATMFTDITRGLIVGSTALRVGPARESEMAEHLQALDAVWAEMSPAVRTIVDGLAGLASGREATRAFIGQSEALLERVGALSQAYRAQAGSARLWLIPLALLLLAAAAIGVLLVRQSREAERLRALQSQTRAADQDNAILRLMNEMANLADGDLSARATVSDDMTGAIADSINYTIDGLSDLVARINVAAEQMVSASDLATQTSTQLLVAAESQSEQIRGASESILQMTRSLEDVSTSATRSADVARQSLVAAEQGALAVHNSISGMNEIRGQIQDTAKRIKRLGESSQQIGEIVALISDITERTQVLALNAAIQAASAGEAGRGFTVVAEEVQRLAERSAGATGQISTIVRTIQVDTQDAVAAMERSTQQVVEGARLSDDAGKALFEIGDVSRRLATLIEGISQSTQAQVRTASAVTESIQSILVINRETSDGTRQTVNSVGELAVLTSLLQESVASFKLA